MNLGVSSVFLVSVVLSYALWQLLSIYVEGLRLSALGFCLGFWLHVLMWLPLNVIGVGFGVWGVPWGCFFFWSFSLLFGLIWGPPEFVLRGHLRRWALLGRWWSSFC